MVVTVNIMKWWVVMMIVKSVVTVVFVQRIHIDSTNNDKASVITTC